MTTRNVIDVILIALLAAFVIIFSAHAQPWNGPPEPYRKPLTLTPERLKWLRDIYLPPAEFDHEFEGELKIERGTQAQLRQWCPGSFNAGWNAMGCAKPYWGGASYIIYILNDLGLQSIGADFEVVLRHERAHCNGWTHPRAR